jgi:phospholipase C
MKQTTITTHYIQGLGDFLDSEGIQWEYNTEAETITFTVMGIKMTPSEVFAFAVTFTNYQNKIQ